MKRKYPLLLLLAFLFIPALASPHVSIAQATSSVLRVGGSGAYTTIQEAINSARIGDTIQVAQGTYMENITITTPKTLTLQGGWDSEFTSRSNDSSLTVIDGGGRDRVINIQTDPRVTIELTIEGFTIQNGEAERGGGIYAQASGSGSTMTLVLANNTVMGNASTNRGGGIFIQSLEGSIVATLTNNTIIENMTNNEGGGIRIESSGGGSAVITLSGNVITGNTVTHLLERQGGWDGGGIAAFTSRSGTTTLCLINNLITGNEAGYGGGVFGYAWGSDASLSITLTNNIIAGNRAQYGGGIFSCSGKTCPISQPGGSVTWTLTNNTITENTASVGVGGIHLASGSTFGDGGFISLSMQNDIVWGNTDPGGGQQLVVGVAEGKSGIATAKASYSDIGLIDTHGGGTYTVDHVIDVDPLFVDPVNQVFLLQDGSPCIDAGDPSSAFNDGSCPPGKGTERNDMGAFGGPSNSDWPLPIVASLLKAVQDKYDNLQVDYNALETDYNELKAENESLQLEYGKLEKEYGKLEESNQREYQKFMAELDSLSSEVSHLKQEYGNIRNLLYIFIATTALFMCLSAYFAIRRQATGEKSTKAMIKH